MEVVQQEGNDKLTIMIEVEDSEGRDSEGRDSEVVKVVKARRQRK